jgi:hypothetical protein
VKLNVKNQAQPFLKISLPPGASILSADVAGEKVKPVEAPDGSRVPLLRTGFRPTDSYPISFVFLHSGAPFAKKGGSEISLPGMDIPINLLEWEIFLPQQYKVKDFGGDAISADLVPPPLQEGTAVYDQMQISPGVANNFKIEALMPGQLGGIVIDPSGAVVSNTRISVTSLDTGYSMRTVTNGAGFWELSNVPSGRIKVQAEANGFKPWVQTLNYDSGRSAQLATTLQIGGTMETVEVTAGNIYDNRDAERAEREARKQAQAAQNVPSSNVINLQRRVAGVLPVAIDVPHAGTAFHFVRPLVVDEETKITFAYKSK